MSFADDLKRFTEKAEKAAERVLRGTAISLFNNVVKRTPVDTGRLRGNWQCTLNEPASGVVDATGQRALSGISSTARKMQLTDSIYLVNNLPYAETVENGGYGDGPKTSGGYSKQAPAGMVKVTVNEFKSIVDQKARQS